jgi:serine/threonine-protein kinase
MALEAHEMTTTCETTLKIGDVLNRKWVILEFVDKGGMGEVYRAHQSSLNREVAIKVVSREWLESLDEDDEEAESLVQRFRREVQAMAQIRHPNILQVFDHDTISVKECDQDAAIEYIVMEYIPGGSLRATMSEEGFYPDEAALKEWVQSYFIPVLTGVMALHDNGIVHRDLKPENVLMDQNTPKIADFGLARSSRLKPVTQSMDVKGSPHYMSPEHFFDFKRTDQRADVYSLGKILFEAVDGKINSGTTPFQSVKLAKTDTPLFQELDRIIQMATAENRDERTESVRGLLRQLERVIHGLEFQKQAGKSSDPHSATLFSKPKWIWTGIIVAVLLVTLMTVWHLMGEPNLRLQLGAVSTSISQYQNKSKPGNGTNTETVVVRDESFVSEHLGKQLFIPGGMFPIAEVAERDVGQSVQVKPFHMDEFFVTNLQFADFLNHNSKKIKIDNGVVKNGDDIWFLLGEARSGYEPIIHRRGKFHVADPTFASSPVLRVTGYGALAFAKFFGRRLPSELEILYTMINGADSPKRSAEFTNSSEEESTQGMMRMMDDWRSETERWSTESWNKPYADRDLDSSNKAKYNTPKFLLSALTYSPNLLGIKGLNHEIGEWVYTEGQGPPSGNASKIRRYAVIGGIEGASKDKNSLPGVVERFPWEGFEEIGFRTVKSAVVGDSAK